MLAITDPEDAYELHVNLITHGRRVCRPRPRCEQCGLRRMCPWFRRARASRLEPVGFAPMSKRPFVVFGIFAALCLVVLPFIALGKEGEEDAAVVQVEPQDQDAKELFADNCGACHTLAAAGTDGVVGPDLDDLLVTSGTNSPEQYDGIYSRVLSAVTCGVGGTDAEGHPARRGGQGGRRVRRRLRGPDRQGPGDRHRDRAEARPAGLHAHGLSVRSQPGSHRPAAPGGLAIRNTSASLTTQIS